MKRKLAILACLVMAQSPGLSYAKTATGTITVSGTVSPTSCLVTGSAYSFGSAKINAINVMEKMDDPGFTITCNATTKASGLKISGIPHNMNPTWGDLALVSASDGTVYRDGVLSHIPALRFPADAASTAQVAILGVPVTPSATAAYGVQPEVNIITPTGTGLFGASGTTIRMGHYIATRGRFNSGIHRMPNGNYRSSLVITLSY